MLASGSAALRQSNVMRGRLGMEAPSTSLLWQAKQQDAEDLATGNLLYHALSGREASPEPQRQGRTV